MMTQIEHLCHNCLTLRYTKSLIQAFRRAEYVEKVKSEGHDIRELSWREDFKAYSELAVRSATERGYFHPLR